MEDTKNPLQVLIDIYDGQVKESNELGYADTFKECTEVLLQHIRDKLSDEMDVHFEDINYKDGYYIFGMGDNSVIDFHVKECPGWLFGIWWDHPTEEDKKSEIVRGKMFTQYEKSLDKFKPTRSNYCTDVCIFFCDGQPESLDYEPYRMISFISQYPNRAFCRDYHGWNYNYEYHTDEECKAEFDKFEKWYENEKKYTAELNQRVVDFVTEKILPCFTGARIYDCGEDTSPQYDIFAPLESNMDIVEEEGYYELFDDDDEYGQAVMKEYRELIEECEKVSDEYKFFWCDPISMSITFRNQDVIDEIFAEQ